MMGREKEPCVVQHSICSLVISAFLVYSITCWRCGVWLFKRLLQHPSKNLYMQKHQEGQWVEEQSARCGLGGSNM